MALQTPILFLIFNRPEQTYRVFGAIRKQQPKQLFIAADGPRNSVHTDQKLCLEAQRIIGEIDWDCQVETLIRRDNLGCKLAVSEAISWFFSQVEMGIILEDDCLPSDSFFTYTSNLLKYYKEQSEILMISGNNFHNERYGSGNGYYFTQIPHIWGWATWRRAWNLYDIKMSALPDFLREDRLSGVAPDKDHQNYWAKRFIATYTNKVNTWDYQWAFAIFNHNGLCICPERNLVENIGFGADATHTGADPDKFHALHRNELTICSHPQNVEANHKADLAEYGLMDIKFESIRNPIKKWIKTHKARRKGKRRIQQFLATSEAKKHLL